MASIYDPLGLLNPWLRGDGKDVNRFVSRPVEKTCSLVSEVHWFHIDTSSNPSDIPLFHLVNNKLWLRGLKVILNTTLDMSKFKLCSELFETSSFAVIIQEKLQEEVKIKNVSIGNVMDSSRFNDYTRLISVTAYVIRFIENL